MRKVSRILFEMTGGYAHWCPGCECMHGIPVTAGRVLWDFNGNFEKPTFNPSIKINWKWAGVDKVCHYFIRDGQIQFCSDSTHALKGQTVDLPDVD